MIRYSDSENRNPGPRTNSVLIWKHPNEEFNTKTQLIVGPAQEAIFVKGGQILKRFIPGTYTLDTKNYPFIRSIVSLTTGGVSPFQCSVYYINKAYSMGIDWGTDSPIRITDPVYMIPVDIRSYGDLSIQVEDGQMLLEKLVGVTDSFSQEEIQQYFTNMMATQIRSLISGYMIQNQLTPLGIDAHLAEMSEGAAERVRAIFEPYGMNVIHFSIASISYTGLEDIEAQLAKETRTNIEFQNQINRTRINTEVEAEKTVKMGQATATANQMLGFSAKERAVADMGLKLAGNYGPNLMNVGNVVTPVVGLQGAPGFGGGVSVEPSAKGTAEIAKALLNNNSLPNESADKAGSFKERVDNLKYMQEAGIITEEEFADAKAKLLSELLGKGDGK